MPEVRGSSLEEQSHVQGAVAVWAQEGQEELLHVQGQFSRSVVSDSLQPHELQHSRPPCPSPTPEQGLNSGGLVPELWRFNLILVFQRRASIRLTLSGVF